MQSPLVVFLGNYRTSTPHAVFRDMAERLAAHDIRMSVDNHWSADYAAADLLIVDEPLMDSDALADCRILGQRTLNRRTRLDVAVRAGAPVAPFGGPRNDRELDRLAASWRTDCVVLKYDWSSRRRGVFLWPLAADKRRPFPPDFNPDSDVFMAFQQDDPRTFKVDAFGGAVLGAYILETRDMRLPAWETVVDLNYPPFELPEKTRVHIAAVSRALLEHGAGYASFDLMRTGDEFRIIEMNTCGVGTGMWDDWPQQYADAYSRAIVDTMARIDRVPHYRDLRKQAVLCGNDAEAIELPRRTANGEAGSDAAEAGPESEPWKTSAQARFMRTMETTDRLSAHEMRAALAGPLETLLRHAREQVPYYADRLDMLFESDGALDLRAWEDVPILRRKDVAGRRRDLSARTLPHVQGSVSHAFTAGTEHAPMTMSRSRLAAAVASCVSMRFFAWHGISFAAPMATIRRPHAESTTGRKWAASFAAAERGDETELSSATPVTAQIEWLRDRGPVWLRTRPSLAQQMALAVKESPQIRPDLLGILTSGEILTEDQRRLCREFLGHVPRDVYELAEVGAVALQCPQSAAYHVQTEAVLVEVLDEVGRGCAKGATGRLVVTPLYNLAMPLIRYDTGDFAIAGDRFDELVSGRLCVCGRRLPRLQSVIGRARNQLAAADGRPLAPAIDSRRLHDLTGARLWQLVQENAGRFVLRLDAEGAADNDSHKQAAEYVADALGGHCEVRIETTKLSVAAAERRFEPYLRQ